MPLIRLNQRGIGDPESRELFHYRRRDKPSSDNYRHVRHRCPRPTRAAAAARWRVFDACWSAGGQAFQTDPAPRAPEICVEVASPGNTEKWLLEKAAAYLDAGAREVIVVELDGRIRFFDACGERADSAFGLKLSVPTF
jgi:Uma2 family endonuclease